MSECLIICEACGCIGKPGYMFMENKTEELFFRHLGHDPYTGAMHYCCSSCNAFLLVDPVEMLSNSRVKGLPYNEKTAFAGTWKDKILPSLGQLLKKCSRKYSGVNCASSTR